MTPGHRQTWQICLLVLLVTGRRHAWTTRFDPHFQKYSKRCFGADFDWRWWKAQAIAESGLDSAARSWAGAQGMMQIMPGTWQGIAPKLGVTSPWVVKDNIQAGIYYDARMWAIWKAPRPLEERLAFTLASYNAGPGHIIKAQRLLAPGQSPNHWQPVAGELHRVTGRHADETRGYVDRIRRLFGRLSHPPQRRRSTATESCAIRLRIIDRPVAIRRGAVLLENTATARRRK